MLSPSLSERVDALIDDLIMDGGVESASLASILLASKDSLRGDYLVTLSRRVWAASCELKAGYALEQATRNPFQGANEASGEAFPRTYSHT